MVNMDSHAFTRPLLIASCPHFALSDLLPGLKLID